MTIDEEPAICDALAHTLAPRTIDEEPDSRGERSPSQLLVVKKNFFQGYAFFYFSVPCIVEFYTFSTTEIETYRWITGKNVNQKMMQNRRKNMKNA